MNELRMPLDPDEIVVPSGRREPEPKKVKTSMELIEKIGLQYPITVRKHRDQYILVTGRYRLEAFRKLERTGVPAVIRSFSDAEARMWELAENLHRAELTKLERSEHVNEWMSLCGKDKSKGISRQVGAKLSRHRGRPKSGVKAAARQLGISEQEARRSVQIASITPEAKQAAIEAGIDDNQSKLLQVAAEPKERQSTTVHEISRRPQTETATRIASKTSTQKKQRAARILEIKRLANVLIELDASLARSLADLLWKDDRLVDALVGALRKGLGGDDGADDDGAAAEHFCQSLTRGSESRSDSGSADGPRNENGCAAGDQDCKINAKVETDDGLDIPPYLRRTLPANGREPTS